MVVAPGHLPPVVGRSCCPTRRRWVPRGRKTRSAWSAGTNEVVRRDLEAQSLVEASRLNPAQGAHGLDGLGTGARRSLQGNTDQLFADPPRTVPLIDDQGVNCDQIPGALELTSSRDGDETNDVSVQLGHHNL